MNVVTVYINGIEYNVKGNEREEYLQKVANYVDSKMKSIMQLKPSLSSVQSATLTAINAVDELFKLDATYEELLDKSEEEFKNQKKLVSQLDKASEDIDKLKEENSKLKKQVMNIDVDSVELLNQEITKLKEEVSTYTNENEIIKNELQTSKYDVVMLKNKLLENQMELVKLKQISNTFHNPKKHTNK